MAATLKKKLGVDVPAYRILGACNPQFAHQALQAEPQIGALLPCNVVVRTNASGKTIVEMMDPRAVLELVGRPEITKIAAGVFYPLTISPEMAAIAMSGSSLLVAANALLLKRATIQGLH